ncbi:uncharacterized protein LOC116174793 [Photinus pyralis]|uniref:uncharacterized protein LOC116174793 n=1 Tax=Photinus pyralis TaxID=7054 RepID=UPI001267049F|nr:uncharacterized protein LOC116174793 [Photinus pyralis]
MMKAVSTSVFMLTLLVSFATAQRVPKHLEEAWDAVTKPFKEECIAKTGVNSVYADRLFLYSEYLDDRALKCYLACLGKNMGILNASDEWVKDEFIRQVAGITPAMFESCMDETKFENDVCEKSMTMAKCIVRHLSI